MFSNSRIINLAEQEAALHPQASLIDYYKLFFQGTFGPAHFIAIEAEAREFLHRELASATSFEEHYYQDVSFIGKFYRVNLKVIADQLVSPEDFFSAFLRSSKFESRITNIDWMQIWQRIEAALKKSSLKISDFEEASSRLQIAFRQNKLSFSHSRIYHQLYQPHYRLLSEEEFLKLAFE